MRILLDTNILVHAHNKSSPHQKRAGDIIADAMAGKITVCLTSQVIYEFFAVITDPKRVESPMNADEAVEVCMDFWECREIEKISPTSHSLMDVLRLAREIKLVKGKIFDCVMAITAKGNGVDCIYTENVSDFRKYRFLNVVNPLSPEG